MSFGYLARMGLSLPAADSSACALDTFDMCLSDIFSASADPCHGYDSYTHISPEQLFDSQISSATNTRSDRVGNDSCTKPQNMISESASFTSFNCMEYQNDSYPASPSTASETPASQRQDGADLSAPITLIEEHSVGISRKERRKLQNRNSQRSFRERTRQREEQLNSQVSSLQLKVELLKRRESMQNQIVETLVWENETLKELLAL